VVCALLDPRLFTRSQIWARPSVQPLFGVPIAVAHKALLYNAALFELRLIHRAADAAGVARALDEHMLDECEVIEIGAAPNAPLFSPLAALQESAQERAAARKRPAADGDGAAAAPAAPVARLRLAPELADVAAAEREVDRFIVTAARTEPAVITVNPLAWWAAPAQRNAFPLLSRAAARFFSAASSAAEVERLFSCAGNVITDLRNRLTPERAGNVVCYAFNYRLRALAASAAAASV
jgi:hypothetical protein